MDEIMRELSRAPRDATPRTDLWPGIESRIRERRERPWLRAAAAVLLFGSGALGGALFERGRLPESRRALEDTAILRVAALQRAGSDYVAAVARLRDLDPDDEPLRAQGYEVALGIVSVTAQEVAAALDLREDALVERSRAVHEALSRRASNAVMEAAQ